MFEFEAARSRTRGACANAVGTGETTTLTTTMHYRLLTEASLRFLVSCLSGCSVQ